MIVNYGDTPASFAFQTSGLGPCFAIKPSQGIVPAKGNVLVRGRRKLCRSWTVAGNVMMCREAILPFPPLNLLTADLLGGKNTLYACRGEHSTHILPLPVFPLCRLVSGSARRMPSPPPAAPRARSMASR